MKTDLSHPLLILSVKEKTPRVSPTATTEVRRLKNKEEKGKYFSKAVNAILKNISHIPWYNLLTISTGAKLI
jgi:hypothetical protein